MQNLEKAIQFLVSPQKDFIGVLENGEIPSNSLHIGAENMKKLRGNGGLNVVDHYVETTKAFFNPDIKGSKRVSIILDEDWHNANSHEFEIFGRHCVKGTEGSKLIGDLEDYRWEDKVHVLRANSINVASHPHYYQILQTIVGDTRIDRIRVGVYGVWTNIKVEYLLFNLQSLEPFFPPKSIGVCEPLTTAPNPSWHDSSIEKFKMLGYQVFENIPDYLTWMGLEQEVKS